MEVCTYMYARYEYIVIKTIRWRCVKVLLIPGTEVPGIGVKYRSNTQPSRPGKYFYYNNKHSEQRGAPVPCTAVRWATRFVSISGDQGDVPLGTRAQALLQKKRSKESPHGWGCTLWDKGFWPTEFLEWGTTSEDKKITIKSIPGIRFITGDHS